MDNTEYTGLNKQSLNNTYNIHAIQSNIQQQLYTFYSIAFKPAESGWGSGSKYTKNYDNIFKSSKKKEEKDEEESTKGSEKDEQHGKMEEGDR